MLMRLQADRKQAMIDKDSVRKDVIQSIIGMAQMSAKNEPNEADREVTAAHILRAVRTEIKHLTEALDMMRNNMTPDKVAVYEAKILIAESYLPPQLQEGDVVHVVKDVAFELGIVKEMKSMGTLKKVLKERIGDNVEGAVLSKVVKDFLTS